MGRAVGLEEDGILEVTRRLGVRDHEDEGRGDACCERDFAGLCAGLCLRKVGMAREGLGLGCDS